MNVGQIAVGDGGMPWEAILGLVGVLVGAAIATGTTIYFAWRVEKDRRLATAYGVLFKVHKMGDLVMKVDQHVSRSWSADSHGMHWPTLLPLAGVRNADDSFSSEELALFMPDSAFCERLIVASNCYHVTLDLMLRYNEERRILNDALAATGAVNMDDTYGRVALDPEQRRLVAPKMRDVENLALGLRNNTSDANQFLIALSADLGPKLAATLRDKRYAQRLGPKLEEPR